MDEKEININLNYMEINMAVLGIQTYINYLIENKLYATATRYYKLAIKLEKMLITDNLELINGLEINLKNLEERASELGLKKEE